MPHELVVTRPFGTRKVGDLIRDPAEVAEVLDHDTLCRNVVKRPRHEPWVDAKAAPPPEADDEDDHAAGKRNSNLPGA